MAKEEVKTAKKARRMNKDLTKYPGKLAITVVEGKKGEMVFDPAELPKEIQAKLPALALSHKLGDSGAGKAGEEAETAITNVWKGMMAGNMVVRTPGKPKVNVEDVKNSLANLTPAEQKTAQALLEKLNILTK